MTKSLEADIYNQISLAEQLLSTKHLNSQLRIGHGGMLVTKPKLQ